MVEKLYYHNAYQKTFSAHVKTCEAKGEKFSIVLDRTAFYPEGGGQPSDIGVLNFVNVLDVKEKGGEIYHITDRPLPAGSSVTGGINWPRRFHLMQQHTGEHIVSGLAHRFFGADNVGFHMSEDEMTVDWNRPLKEEQLAVIERLANEAVYRNIPVRTYFPAAEELEKMEYRSKKELSGSVRIVSIPGCDVCACCGTHVAVTGEIGAVKLLGAQRYKGGTRVRLVCGAQAMEDYARKQKNVAEISSLLSAKQAEIFPAVKRLSAENSELKHTVSGLQGRVLELKASTVPKGCGNICLFEDDLSSDDLRRFASMVAGRCGGLAAVFCGHDGNYRYALAGCEMDVRPAGRKMNAAFLGHGGGSSELMQGSLKGGREELKRYFCENLQSN
jgi:alanyl-tRNA synthetase